MRGKFVLAPNGDQLVPSCLSVLQGLSAFQGIHSEGFKCKSLTNNITDTITVYVSLLQN